jgi:hypothetical protein
MTTLIQGGVIRYETDPRDCRVKLMSRNDLESPKRDIVRR